MRSGCASRRTPRVTPTPKCCPFARPNIPAVLPASDLPAPNRRGATQGRWRLPAVTRAARAEQVGRTGDTGQPGLRSGNSRAVALRRPSETDPGENPELPDGQETRAAASAEHRTIAGTAWQEPCAADRLVYLLPRAEPALRQAFGDAAVTTPTCPPTAGRVYSHLRQADHRRAVRPAAQGHPQARRTICCSQRP